VVHVLLVCLASRFPVLTTAGNHEYGSAEAFQSYRMRYPTPYRQSKSTHVSYWGKEVGPVHIIALCSYAHYSEESLQYAWLSNYLASSIDRQRTPWVIVMLHTPFYSSNQVHWMEGELMRQSMEELLYEAGVDVVIAGHVHSYERTFPLRNNVVDACGPTHVTIGDGGNYEGPAASWRMDPNTPDGAPVWSAFREASFGVADMEALNKTHLSFAWHRHACGSSDPDSKGIDTDPDCSTPGDTSSQAMLTVDEFYLVRPPIEQCPNRWRSSAIMPAPGADRFFALPSNSVSLRSGSVLLAQNMEAFSLLSTSAVSSSTIIMLLSGIVVVLCGLNAALIFRIKKADKKV
jgi:hypothetical protein